MTRLGAVAAVTAAILIVPFYCGLGAMISEEVDLNQYSDETVRIDKQTKWMCTVPRGATVMQPDGTPLTCPNEHPEPYCVFRGETSTTETYKITDRESGSAKAEILPLPVSPADPRKLYSCRISSIPGTNSLTLALNDTNASPAGRGAVPLFPPGTYTTPEEYELDLVLDCTDPAHSIIVPVSVTYTASSITFPNGFETGDFTFYLVDASDFEGTANWDTGEFSVTLQLALDMPNFRIDDGTDRGAPLVVSGTITGLMTPSPKEFMGPHVVPAVGTAGTIVLFVALGGLLAFFVRKRSIRQNAQG